MEAKCLKARRTDAHRSRGTALDPEQRRGDGMDIIDHASEPLDEWRAGVMTRMLVSALTGAERLCTARGS